VLAPATIYMVDRKKFDLSLTAANAFTAHVCEYLRLDLASGFLVRDPFDLTRDGLLPLMDACLS